MKLSAFRIKNFRSMVDSNITYLSTDNITALIGQNESGKTTILEALNCFSTSIINEDMLRSDATLPIISCNFVFDENYLTDYLDLDKIPPGLQKKLLKKKSIWLERTWRNTNSSSLKCSDTELVEFYNSINECDKARIKNIHNYLFKINGDTNDLRSEIKIIEKDYIDLLKESENDLKKLNKAKRNLDRAKKPELLQQFQYEFEAANKIYSQKEIDLAEIKKILNDKKEKLEEFGESDGLAARFILAKQHYDTEVSNFENTVKKKEHYENLFSNAINTKEADLFATKIEHLKNEEKTQLNFLLDANFNLDFIERVAEKVLEGKNSKVSESEVKIELSKQKAIYTLEQIGEEVSKHIPVFEFFEDFSSLLPNRIDLSDLFEQNSFTEGYKAVTNFLAISGLNYNFFEQENDRILKQRIETLNGEITINFHEFWSQKISTQNKIHLNFELEHYNSSIPEKSGKPYLEFWIKDNFERLYPKQRSRGVRWFLSFYLELKATALSKKRKILLIDEPGISLHAKAQHDVLKVFENLKNDLQIIYTTHSPQLIDTEKMYRILAVQRNESEGMHSESKILDSKSLISANSETMMPIFSVLSEHIIRDQHLIKDRNLIVADLSTFYYLSAFSKLFKKAEDIHFIPSNGVNKIPLMTNMLTGWRTDFSVLLPGNSDGHKVFEELKNTIFINNKQIHERKIILMEVENIIDLISKFDFKKHILKKRTGIPESNSEYIELNNLSENYLASQFATMVDNKEIQKDLLDEQTILAISELMAKIENLSYA